MLELFVMRFSSRQKLYLLFILFVHTLFLFSLVLFVYFRRIESAALFLPCVFYLSYFEGLLFLPLAICMAPRIRPSLLSCSFSLSYGGIEPRKNNGIRGWSLRTEGAFGNAVFEGLLFLPLAICKTRSSALSAIRSASGTPPCLAPLSFWLQK